MDHDEGYVIIEHRTGNFGTFVWGLLAGAAVALLFAPKSGRETRDELTDSYYRLRDEAEERMREVQDSVTATVEDVRRQLDDSVDSARRAVDSGREAARASTEAFRSGYDAARTNASAEGGPATGDGDGSTEA